MTRRRTLTALATLCCLALIVALAIGRPSSGTPTAGDTTTSALRTTAAPGSPEQWRGYWVDSFNEGFGSPEQVSTLVADAQAAGANALVVQVSRWMDCYCNDSSFPRTGNEAVQGAPFDPLAEVVTQAHAAGIEVHAWVNSSIMWSSSTPPSAPDHVFTTHGPSAQGADRWLNKRVDGAEQVGTLHYLDLANPAAADYVANGVLSLARAYDIDGINLDYIRYPDDREADTTNEWGYSETSLARFAAETARTDVPAPSDPQFTQWRRDQVTDLVRRVYVGLAEVDPTDRLSINAVTNGRGPSAIGWESTRPYADVLQDWRGWLSDGIVDTVTAMNYKRESSPEQAAAFDEWNAALAEFRSGRHVVSGAGLYLNTVEGSVAQARRVLDAGLDGWNGYSFANTTKTAADQTDVSVQRSERAALTGALRSQVFTGDAVVPEMTWKTAPTTGMVAGNVQGAGVTDVVLEPLDPSSTQPVAVRTDGTGWFAAVGLTPGEYQVEAPAVAPGTSATVTVEAGTVAHTDLGATG